jgi:hypothetical protein
LKNEVKIQWSKNMELPGRSTNAKLVNSLPKPKKAFVVITTTEGITRHGTHVVYIVRESVNSSQIWQNGLPRRIGRPFCREGGINEDDPQ